jgi:hypothetical protein
MKIIKLGKRNSIASILKREATSSQRNYILFVKQTTSFSRLRSQSPSPLPSYPLINRHLTSDSQVGKITSELELKDQKTQNELNRIEFERERRKVIKEVRSEAHALSAARRKKAEDYRQKLVSLTD